MPEDRDWFAARLHEYLDSYLTLTAADITALFEHFQLLLRWNAKINLTSIRSPEQAVIRHYCESLFFASRLAASTAGTTVADIGSGAGFPGVPVAVLHSDWQVTLVESHQRKSVFLRESTRHLKNITVSAMRGEQLQSRFDLVVSRAVNPEDVVKVLPRLSNRIGLLIGASDFEQLRKTTSITWSEAVPVPWSERRVCAFGTGPLAP